LGGDHRWIPCGHGRRAPHHSHLPEAHLHGAPFGRRGVMAGEARERGAGRRTRELRGRVSTGSPAREQGDRASARRRRCLGVRQGIVVALHLLDDVRARPARHARAPGGRRGCAPSGSRRSDREGSRGGGPLDAAQRHPGGASAVHGNAVTIARLDGPEALDPRTRQPAPTSRRSFRSSRESRQPPSEGRAHGDGGCGGTVR
jgi:hypothetical protein